MTTKPPNNRVRVALRKLGNYDDPRLAKTVKEILDHALPANLAGARVLVKPNLLVARELACANPEIVTLVCRRLLAMGAVVTVADSPGFGSARSVARAIGLESKLNDLGLETTNFSRPVSATLSRLPGNPKIKIAAQALECDLVVSIAKVKAHAQTRLTLSVKNCFGCVCGSCKAMAHARFGATTEKFCLFLAAIWERLPPVVAVADGVIAMHVTGPSRGAPFPLGLLGASSFAPALDAAIIRALAAENIPLQNVLETIPDIADLLRDIEYPLDKPEDFAADAANFVLPQNLAPASFNPARLLKSLCKRWWNNFVAGRREKA